MKKTTNPRKYRSVPPTYSLYHSSPDQGKRSATLRTTRKKHFGLKLFSVLILALIIWGVYTGFKAKVVQAPASASSNSVSTKQSQTKTQSQPETTVATVNHCSDNTLSQLLLVSISQRQLWACNGSAQAYASAVVTGMEFLPADLTPTGTYHIYAKETNVYLKGSDSTGSWDDYVYYWMPFLDNKYGVYGFHDATWRAATAFGNISPDSSNASHGCVECPLATAKWLYDWSQIGTTVTVES